MNKVLAFTVLSFTLMLTSLAFTESAPTATTDKADTAPSSSSAPASAADDADKPDDRPFFPTSLPKDDSVKLAGDDKDLARVSEALEGAKLVKFEKLDVRVVDKAPFVCAEHPAGVVLGGKKTVETTMNKPLTHLLVLVAVLDPDKDALAQLTILRGDGVPTRIKFTPSVNCGPSVGKWEGKLEAKKEIPGSAKVVMETKSKDGTPVRLFLLDWRNDNEWYPVSDLKFKVLDAKAKTRFVLLGVTGVGGVKQ